MRLLPGRVVPIRRDFRTGLPQERQCRIGGEVTVEAGVDNHRGRQAGDLPGAYSVHRVPVSRHQREAVTRQGPQEFQRSRGVP